MRNRVTFSCIIALVILAAQHARAVVIYSDTGDWPSDWPEALEPLRHSARTIRTASARHENTYVIKFNDRETFERVWPIVVELKTPGAPLKIKSIRSEPEDEKSNVEDSKATPEIRIRAPSENLVGTDGKGRLRAGPPWPKDIVGDNGELPEYVTCREQNRILKWVPWELRKNDGGQVPLTRRHRARIDLEIVVDGEIIDLNRIRLPKDTPINDVRVLD